MEVEHHWHEPSLGQVTKAVAQYLTESGVTVKAMDTIISSKVTSAINECVNRLLNSGRFDTLVVAAVADCISNEKKCFEVNKYGFNARIRDLVNEKIKELVLSEYAVSITKKSV